MSINEDGKCPLASNAILVVPSIKLVAIIEPLTSKVLLDSPFTYLI
jgi:hypothetical protein